MTKLAKLDQINGKWVATYRGMTLASSKNREYVEFKINSGDCRRANDLGVTGVEGFHPVTLEEASRKQEQQEVERFSINQRFDFLKDLVEMVGSKRIPSLIITGEGGLGKTHTVFKTLSTMGLTDTRNFLMNALAAAESEDGDGTDVEYSDMKDGDYTVVKGYSSAKGLYRTLYENRDKIVIFDDCDIQKNPDAALLLKGALDSYDERWINWNVELSANDDLPRCFRFTGQVIFISNTPLMKFDQAIRSRSMCVDVSMTDMQKIERMSVIISEDDFMPEFEMHVKVEALNFLEKFVSKAREISLRTLISVVKIVNKGGKWQDLAEYVLCN